MIEFNRACMYTPVYTYSVTGQYSYDYITNIYTHNKNGGGVRGAKNNSGILNVLNTACGHVACM